MQGDTDTLIPRIEQATAEQVRELLEEAWLEIHHDGYPPENERDTCRKCDRFARLLDAEAWTSAAELLVPEGMLSMTVNCGMEERKAPDFSKATAFVGQWDNVGGEPCEASTPALALAAACLRAKG